MSVRAHIVHNTVQLERLLSNLITLSPPTISLSLSRARGPLPFRARSETFNSLMRVVWQCRAELMFAPQTLVRVC